MTKLSVHYVLCRDFEEAAQFLDLIAEDEMITFQTFDDVKNRKDPKLVRVLHGSLEQHLQALIDLNKQGAGIFFTVNTTDLQGREAKNVIKIRALFVDLDGVPLEPVLSAPLSPHIIVETSPKRFHAYWIVDGIELEHFSYIQKELIKRFNADPCVYDLPRVMRLPGFFHNKEESFFVKVIESSGAQAYQSSEFLEKFQIDLQLSNIKKEPQLGPSYDSILKELDKRGMIKRQLANKQGAWEIICPWIDLHTTGDKGTVYFEPNTNGYKGAGFICQHSHCIGKNIDDLRFFLGLKLTEIWDDPILLNEELLSVMNLNEGMLPEVLRPWILDNAKRMQVPADFLAVACIVVLGSVIGRKVGIFPKAYDSWLVIPNLWGAIVGRPSLLKSPAIAEVMKFLEELIAKAIVQYREDIQRHEQKEMWIEVQKSAQKEEMKKIARNKKEILEMPQFDLLEPIDKPVLKRYKTEDGTVEKIGEILLENPQGILIHRDELVGWLKGLDKSGREGDRAFYLESWNGNGSFTVDRIGRGTLHISALCLSIFGGIQPGPLGSYVNHAVNGGVGDDGLLQRFQLLVWPDAPKIWKNVDCLPDSIAHKQIFEIFQYFDAFEPFGPSKSEAFEIFKLHFTTEGQKLFDEWRNNLEQRLCSGELNPALESHLAKYRSLMPSLALIFYLVETVGKGSNPVAVDDQATRRAIQWCVYLETHAKRLYASGENADMESARALLNRIKKGDILNGFSLRDVYHGKHWSKLTTADQVSNAIKVLEELGWVRSKIIKTGGRDSVKVFIHPQLLNDKFKEL